MENFSLQNDIRLLCVKADSFPDGIKGAQEKLLSLIKPDAKRSYYGISYLYDDEILYMAGVDIADANEKIPDDCTIYSLKEGNYNSIYITDFAKDISQIDHAFKQLLAVPAIDENGCCAECYLPEGDDFFTAKDMRCMVRLAD